MDGILLRIVTLCSFPDDVSMAVFPFITPLSIFRVSSLSDVIEQTGSILAIDR